MSDNQGNVTVEYAWQDDGLAAVSHLVCPCGNVIIESKNGKIFDGGETIDCPKCGKRFKFVYRGMTVEQVIE